MGNSSNEMEVTLKISLRLLAFQSRQSYAWAHTATNLSKTMVIESLCA